MFVNLNIFNSVAILSRLFRKTWYVRPSGGSYGTEDGTSYDNAWDGFDNIDWTDSGVQPGDTLYICGVHSERLLITTSGTASKQITISFNYTSDPGSIDGEDTLLQCISNTGSYLTFESTITNKTLYDATDSCFVTGGTSTGVILNGMWGDGSGNQAFQNIDTCSVVYNNCKGSNNVDDGMSMHNSPVVICNNCEFSDNAQGVNAINSGTITLNGCIIENNTSQNIQPQVDCDFTLNDCILDSGDIQSSSSVPLKLNRCLVIDSDVQIDATTTLQCFDTHFIGSGRITNLGILYMDRCFVNSTNITPISSVGDLYLDYSIFKDNGCTQLVQAGGTNGVDTIEINNCDFVDENKNVRALEIGIDGTVSNCIFTGCSQGIRNINGSTTTAYNNCYYDNTYDTYVSGVGTINDNDPVTTDPKLINIAENDFTLDTGSSCLGTGKALTEATGIYTADWGNGTDEAPVITTVEQSTSWDIGAYITGGLSVNYMKDSYGNIIYDSYGNPILLPN